MSSVTKLNKETALMAILRGLLFHWSAMTWFPGMDTRLRLGRERFERVVSELRSLNNRLPQYMSPLPDRKALAVNALAVSWDGMNAYAFPPTPLILAVLNKVRTDKVRLCLIAPCWPSQAWFPTLPEFLTDHSRRLPERDHLLWHPLGRVYHNSPSFTSFRLGNYQVPPPPPSRNYWLPNLVWERRSSSGLSTLPKLVDFLNYLFRKETFCLSH
jgi:hypothetical protein